MAITAAAGGGNWSAGGTWVGGNAPGASDDVLLTVASGNVTIDGTSGTPNLCKSLVCTGYTGTLTQGSGATLNIGTSTSGNLTLVAGMTYSPNSAAVINFVSTTGTNNITFGAHQLPTVNFNGVGGTWQFQDVASISTCNLLSGTVDFNGKTFGLNSFSASGSTVRTLTMGASAIIVNNQTWDCSTSTNLTITANTATITFSSSSSNITFSGGAKSWPTLTINSSGDATITGANTFATLTRTGSAATTDTLILGANQTVSGTFTCSGNSVINRVLLCSDTLGTRRTVTAATVTVTNLDIRDITGAGAGSWNVSAVTGGAGNATNNSGITFSAPKNCYMKTAVSVNWSASNWYTTSGGSTPISPVIPLLHDTAVFDVNSVTAGSKTITLDMPRIGAVNWTGVANTPAWAKSGAFEAYGSITMVSGMTNTGTQICTFSNQDAGVTLTTGTLVWTNAITVNTIDQTVTQGDNFSGNRASATAFLLTSGTWATSTFTFTLTGASARLRVSGGTFTAGATVSLTGTTAASITVDGGTLDATGQTVSMTGAGSTTTLSSGTLNAGTLTRTGLALAHSGSNMTIGSGGVSAATYTFSGSTACTISMGSGTWTVSGTGTVWNNTNSSITWTPGTSTIAITDTSASTKTFTGNGATYAAITVSGAAANGTLTFSEGNTFTTFTAQPDASLIFTISTTTTVSSLAISGTSGHLVTVVSSAGGTAATISCSGAVDVDYVSIKDNTASNNIDFYAGTHSTNVSGNSNWAFVARPAAGSGAVIIIGS